MDEKLLKNQTSTQIEILLYFLLNCLFMLYYLFGVGDLCANSSPINKDRVCCIFSWIILSILYVRIVIIHFY